MSQPTLPEITKAQHGTALHDTCLALRVEVLRTPLGLPLLPEDLTTEANCHHFSALVGERVVGAAALEKRRNSTFYLKQLAVSPTLQHAGVGRQLMASMEAFARAQGAQLFCLHSRVTAQNFYQKLGYQLEGGSFLAFTIPHIGLYKWL